MTPKKTKKRRKKTRKRRKRRTRRRMRRTMRATQPQKMALITQTRRKKAAMTRMTMKK